MLEEGDSDPSVQHPYLQLPARGVWPTRLFNPPRQNLSFYFEGNLRPVAIEVHWVHWKQVDAKKGQS
jgi:hypothetical protein